MECATLTTLENEEWRPVIDYEGLYEVSNFGRVISLRTNKILQQKNTTWGYRSVNLYDCNRKLNTKYVHRLVAVAFVPNPYNHTEVNHKDECKTNNLFSNLEWCDRKYNLNYGTWKDKVSANFSKRVEQLTIDGKHVAFYGSLKQASEITGFCSKNIQNAIYGRYKQANGYIWRYVEK